MSQERPRVPEALRNAVAADLPPVRPLAPPWLRCTYVLPIALVAMAMPFVYFQVRDTGELGMMLAWVPIGIQILLAMALFVLALKEGIPGWRASATTIVTLCLSAFALQVVVNYLIFLRSPMVPAGGNAMTMWMSCFRTESLIALPILIGIAWLTSRALPARPMLAGFLVGTGAGMAGDASWRMFCAYSDPAHVLMGHTGGILALGATGFLLGYLWTLYANQRQAADRQAL